LLETQATVPLAGAWQVVPHAPQLFESFVRLSQDVGELAGQPVVPLMHENPQTLALHVGMELDGPFGQM
jgi:hypothetical protein